MKNIDDPSIERYLRDEMTAAERLDFEAEMSADPALRQTVDESRVLAEGIRFAAGRDIRRRAVAARDHYRRTEWLRKLRPKIWVGGALFVLAGLLLGYLIFSENEIKPPTMTPSSERLDSVEIAENNSKTKYDGVSVTEFEVIFQGKISGSRSGDSTSYSVAVNPKLQKPQYAFYGPDGGICFFVRPVDDFWKKLPLQITQSGKKFFLKIGEEMFLLKDDGEEHDFPFKPSGN